MSLRRRLLGILASLFVFAWVVAFAAAYAATARSIETLFDAQLAHDAGVLLALAQTRVNDPGGAVQSPRDPSPDMGRYQKKLAFRIWRGGRLELRSASAPELAPSARDGYQSLEIDGSEWRGFTTRSADGALRVWVGEQFSVRHRLRDEIIRDMLFPLLLGLPLLAAAVGWGVRRGLTPLDRASAEVAERSPSNLEPLRLDRAPAEISGLVTRLNDLLARLREDFGRERRFTADAAHELRTPLAGIRTNAQVALRTEDAGQRRELLMEVIRGVDRTTHLVEQLLTLARLDRETLENGFRPVELGALAAETIVALDPDAAAKHIAVSLQHAGPTEVSGNAVVLGMMIRNLMDNAIRYTPAGGTVQVRGEQEGSQVRLRVTDSGPGIPDSERARVFERFYRGSTASGFGCGLGLSIVQRVAELHGARVTLSDAPGDSGLQVEVLLPSARPTADEDDEH